eukprot:TRINITY_DN8406_c0_g1_i1.p1 TRINITY_DN8406_c0_g1~~TRINITY_DN8406_c0_g1_i1.p1  ORF type:complete len:203 (-),score=29.18 TRINITY_DN8406_c0_g1_i1:599-1207(-)
MKATQGYRIRTPTVIVGVAVLCLFIYFVLMFQRISSTTTAVKIPPKKTAAPSPQKGLVCIIVRTYEKQAVNLPNLIKDLQELEYPNWRAFLVNTDLKSFPLLPYTSLDKRVSASIIHATKVYTHITGFELTDQAIRLNCPKESEWLLVTNGDNYYSPSFLNHLNSSFDITAVDFYSRHWVVLDPVASKTKNFAGDLEKIDLA